MADAPCSDDFLAIGQLKRDPPFAPNMSPCKVYKCNWAGCNRLFYRPSSLDGHRYSHTGPWSYACRFPGCSRTYLFISNLRRHARGHRNQSLDIPSPTCVEEDRSKDANQAQTVPCVLPLKCNKITYGPGLHKTVAVTKSDQSTRDPFPRNSKLCLDGLIIRRSPHSVAAGGSADIWEGFLGDQHVAVKILRQFSSSGRIMQRRKLLRRIWREYLAWSCLAHPNVLLCLGFSYDFSLESHKLPSLISPWMSNGSAITYLENHPDTDRTILTDGIVDGLCYLHTRDPPIVHGDIRAGNVFISHTGVPCLGDFGLSRILGEVRGMTTSSEVAGSLRWMSPELLCEDNGATVHSDVWAFGMTVLEIFSGYRPYSDIKSDVVVFGQIIKGKTPPRPEGAQHLSEQLWNLCQYCWSLQADQRPAMDVVKSQLIEQAK